MVNMSAEDLQTKYDGNLNSEMVGPLHNLIAKVRKYTNVAGFCSGIAAPAYAKELY